MFKLCFLCRCAWDWLVSAPSEPGSDANPDPRSARFCGSGYGLCAARTGHLWGSRPAAIMLFASIAVLALVAALAIGGVLMTPIAPAIWRAVGRYPRLRLGIGLYQSGGLSSPADRLKLKRGRGATIADQF